MIPSSLLTSSLIKTASSLAWIALSLSFIVIIHTMFLLVFYFPRGLPLSSTSAFGLDNILQLHCRYSIVNLLCFQLSLVNKFYVLKNTKAQDVDLMFIFSRIV